MADCVECGHRPDETGHQCNRCGAEVCWDHRHPDDHDCESGRDATASAVTGGAGSGERAPEGPDVEEWVEADPGAGELTAVDRGEDWSRPDHGVEAPAPPVDAEEWDADDRRFPWWVYALLALAVAVAPFGGLLVSILL